jgi:hypothetical protein
LYSEAICEYKRALDDAPQDAELHYMLAESCARKGWHIGSRALYCAAFRLDAVRVRRLQSARIEAESPATSGRVMPKAVFVLGCPHSGTTITTRLLAAHPDLMHAELVESHAFMKPTEQLVSALGGWDSRCRGEGKSGWVEKSVGHSFLVPRMLHHRPDAVFVIVMRDGRDVTASIKARSYAYRDFRELARLWLYMNRELMFHQGRHGFHVLRYEHLVRHPEAALEQMCHAIGVSFDASMLDFHRKEISWNGYCGATFTTAVGGHDDHHKLRHWQINQPLFDGRGRWRSELTEGEKNMLKLIAGREIQEWGYATNSDW